MKKRVKTVLSPYLFLLPCALLILVILIYPVLSGLVNSFYNENLIRPITPVFVGVENYAKLMKDSMFLNALWRSIVWTVVILIFEMAMGLLFAVLLSKDIYCKKLFRCLVLIPWIIPNAIAGIIWKWFLNESFGMMNYLLKSTGLISHNLAWLSDEKMAAVSVVTVIIWKSIPFVAITLLAGIQAIPGDLYEAAKVDGARSSQCFRFITVPMLRNIMLITAILTSIWNFNQLEIIQVVTKGGPGEATLSLPVYIYRLFMQTFQTSYASAAAVVMMMVLIIPCIVYVRKLLKE
ncbi:carbohydrate ABC transporter permease [Murimonas intestini]|uniref:Carbohydrate ABC transporter membrane protein 1 (CUT1 family) n=1 Tax=Murimonas intestini TaxID=1337051 RepID=A0AB73SXP6_9FIRM|nr:sugar ABC transporter permease [Murimonas intestini]MCR1843376.1 sugar ABC transporter permease [Murimonas intestini]MCR1868684.1 sugar ABC transporter permease [Murimonas intestini]MCR1886350.1 sugar ABC transporter permease [Murimonas intestini]